MLTHSQESELNMKRERELDVMPDVEQVGKRWENTEFISVLQLSSVEPDIRALCQILT